MAKSKPTTLIDLTGQRFGRLTVVFEAPSAHRERKWFCRCDCGGEARPTQSALRRGHTQSCGCYRREMLTKSLTTHGKRHEPEYHIWHHMIKRCTDRKDKRFNRYGGRGITVCARWQRSFGTFYADLGPRPTPQHSLDRRDNDGNYQPSNCRWATRLEQANNTSANRIIKYQGRSQTLSEWARELGVPATRIRSRLDQFGYSIERALMKPKRGHRN